MANNLDFALIVRLVDNLTGPLRGVGQALDGVAKQAAKLQEVGARLQNVGAAATAVSAGLTAGIVKTVSAFADLEDATTRAEVAFMGVGGVVDPVFATIQKQAADLGGKLPGTVKDFTSMASALKEAGLSAQTIAAGGLEATANLRVLMGNLAPEQAAQLMATFKNSLGIAEADFLKFVDVVQRNKFAFGIDPQEFAYTAKYIGPIAQQLGLGGLEASKSMLILGGTLSEAGIKGEQLGTSMRSVFLALPKMTETLQKKGLTSELAAAGIHLSFFKDGKFLGLENMIAQLGQLKALGPQKMLAIISEMFGTESAPAIAKLIESGIAGYNAAGQKLANQATLQARVDKVLGTFRSQWEAAMGAIEGTMATAGGLFGDNLKTIAQTIGSVSEALGDWITANPELARTIGMVVVGLTGFAAAVATLGLVGGTIIAGLGMLGSALAVLLGPIGLIAGAFAGTAYLIYDNWEAVQTFFGAFGLAFRNGLAPLEPVLNSVRMAWAALVNWIGGGSSAISGWLSGSAVTAMANWGAQAGALAKQAVAVLADILAGIGTAARTAWAALSPALGPMMVAFRGLGGALVGLWNTVSPLLGSLFGGLSGVGGLGPVWSGFGALVGGVARAIIQAITGMVSVIAGIVGTIASVIAAVVAVFNGGSGQIGDALRAIPRAVIAAFDGMPGQMLKLGGDIIAGLARGIAGAAGQAVEALSGVASGLVGKFTGLLGIKSPSRVFAGFGENVMQGLGQGIGGGLGAVLSEMGSAGSALARTGAAALTSASMAMAAPAMASPAGGAGAAGGGGMNVTIHITIQAPSGDPAAIAQAVRGAAPDLARQLGSLTSRQARVSY